MCLKDLQNLLFIENYRCIYKTCKMCLKDLQNLLFIEIIDVFISLIKYV
jgi:hypothetical protein